jgi:beta-mannosidase
MRQNLNGTWTIYCLAQGDKIYVSRARVPGSVHEALLENHHISDPYFRDNERHLLWIGEKDWIFERSFVPDTVIMEHPHKTLFFSGLDTLARIYLNGIQLGETDNQFRSWSFDVTDVLTPGENLLKIIFLQTMSHVTSRQEERYLNAMGVGHHRIDGSNRIRKSQCNYGWDWGPMCVTCGVTGSVELVAPDKVEINIEEIFQKHLTDRVSLSVSYHIQHLQKEAAGSRDMAVQAQIELDGNMVAKREEVFPFSGMVELEIRNPRLWWTHDLGDQPLYQISITLVDGNGKPISCDSRRIGLRKIELVQRYDKWGKSFAFALNEVELFAKGANWIPADTFPTRVSNSDYRYLITSSREANMNMLRVWGGGIYEPEIFYDLCDEQGILVWQDLMFACSAYPVYEDQWLNTTIKEIREQVARLRHHPSIALWCGNNEIEQINDELVGNKAGQMSWTEYCRFFDRIIPELLNRMDPQRPYWPSSPHTPDGNRLDANDKRSGDAHLWEVWHGRQPFEWYRTCEHRFVSEFGFQSLPQLSAIMDFTNPEDRNINSYVMDLHQRSPIGNDAIMQYLLAWFQLPGDIDAVFRGSQILQGLAMKYAIDHWRRSKPRCMGTLYWQLNDCWPAASWSSIDWKGNWKALHYFARRFFAPVTVTGVESIEDKSCSVWVVNDRRTTVQANLTWKLITTEGCLVESGSLPVDIPPSSSCNVHQISFSNELEVKRMILALALEEDGNFISTDMVLFTRPKYLELFKPAIQYEIVPSTDNTETSILSISTDRPALWTWIEIPGVVNHFGDNFFHLMPDEKREISVPVSFSSLADRNITLGTLYDMWH